MLQACREAGARFRWESPVTGVAVDDDGVELIGSSGCAVALPGRCPDARRGWFATRRDGREAWYALTGQCLTLLDEGRMRIFTRRDEPWDGRWSMAVCTVPETERATTVHAGLDGSPRHLDHFAMSEAVDGERVPMDVPTAVVTGAASGIGRALAFRLSAAGTRLVLADVQAEALAGVAAELDALAVPTDVSDHRAVDALAAAAPDAQLVCLNAGVVGPSLGAPWEVSAQEWDRMFGVNVSGVVNGLRAFVPRLLASGRPAHVLITASLAGLATFPGGGAYGAAKHAVVAVAEQAALALAGTDVGVTLLCPALVRTAMSDVGADPADVAAEALAAVEHGVFAVVPEEWQAAIIDRSQRLASGRRPTAPAPTQPGDAPGDLDRRPVLEPSRP